eukprot:gene17644-biopygen1301
MIFIWTKNPRRGFSERIQERCLAAWRHNLAAKMPVAEQWRHSLVVWRHNLAAWRHHSGGKPWPLGGTLAAQHGGLAAQWQHSLAAGFC